MVEYWRDSKLSDWNWLCVLSQHLYANHRVLKLLPYELSLLQSFGNEVCYKFAMEDQTLFHNKPAAQSLLIKLWNGTTPTEGNLEIHISES